MFWACRNMTIFEAKVPMLRLGQPALIPLLLAACAPASPGAIRDREGEADGLVPGMSENAAFAAFGP